MKKISLIMLTAVLAFTFGCTQKQMNYKQEKTGMQLQAIQKKEFETTYDIAFASTMSVFQDSGYVIEAANKDTGLITAASNKNEGFIFFVGQSIEFVKATGFLEKMPSGLVSIRLNFVNEQQTSSGYGMKGGNSVPIEDPKFYQGVFEKIKKAIFVRTSTN